MSQNRSEQLDGLLGCWDQGLESQFPQRALAANRIHCRCRYRLSWIADKAGRTEMENPVRLLSDLFDHYNFFWIISVNATNQSQLVLIVVNDLSLKNRHVLPFILLKQQRMHCQIRCLLAQHCRPSWVH